MTEHFYRSVSAAVDRIAMESWGPTLLRAACRVAQGQAPPALLVDVTDQVRRTIHLPEARVAARSR